jgi:hypothetical protein
MESSGRETLGKNRKLAAVLIYNDTVPVYPLELFLILL